MGILGTIHLMATAVSMGTSLSIDTDFCQEGFFRCNSSATCISQRQNCDARIDCPDGSDEWNCDDVSGSMFWDHLFRKHPAAERDEQGDPDCDWRDFNSTCVCKGSDIYCQYKDFSNVPRLPRKVMLLDLSGNSFERLSNLGEIREVNTLVLRHCGVKHIERNAFRHLTTMDALYLDHNEIEQLEGKLFPPRNVLKVLVLSSNRLKGLSDHAFRNLGQLRELDLKENFLTALNAATFRPLHNLHILYLNGNRLASIKGSFPRLRKLEELSLANNLIGNIEPNALYTIPRLQYLFLSENRLTKLNNGSMNNLKRLVALNLNGNRIEHIEEGVFDSLRNLTSLSLKGNRFRNLSHTVLKALVRLEYIYFDDFGMCRAARWVRVCEPKGDGISSQQHLLDNPILRASVWVMAVCACLGNILVLLGRLVARESNAVHGLYIRHLAISDLLMGIYLIGIALADIVYSGYYIDYEERWRHSFACNLCGFLSTLSSESTTLILTLVTWDRFVSVTQPLARRQPSPRRAVLQLLALWLASGLIAVLPLTGISYFGDEFYGSNGVCLSLQIHAPFAKGWEYSAVMFILVNTVALVFIIYAYVRMLREIRNSRAALRSTQESQDRVVTQRFGVIVVTDCLCWLPVITIKLIALFGLRVDEGLYAWLAVFVLPINSALNPVLYTLTTTMFKQQLSGVFEAVRTRVCHRRRLRRHRSTIRNDHSDSGLSYSLGSLPVRHVGSYRTSSTRTFIKGGITKRYVRNRRNGSDSCSKVGSLQSISLVSLSSMRASERRRNCQPRRVEESTPFITARLEGDPSVQAVVTAKIETTSANFHEDGGVVCACLMQRCPTGASAALCAAEPFGAFT